MSVLACLRAGRRRGDTDFLLAGAGAGCRNSVSEVSEGMWHVLGALCAVEFCAVSAGLCELRDRSRVMDRSLLQRFLPTFAVLLSSQEPCAFSGPDSVVENARQHAQTL